MGVQPKIEFDLIENIRLGSNDMFLLCSDGLSNYVPADELRDIALSHSPQGACDMLVDLANSRGGHDNITVQIVHVKRGESFLRKMLQ
jgi:protein phosphatase